MAPKLKAGTQFGVEPKKIQDFVAEIDGAEEKMASKRGEYMNYCKKRREEIAAVVKEAKDAGIDKAALNLKLEERRALRKIEEKKRSLESEQVDMFDYLGQCLGETDESEPRAATPKFAAESDKALKEAIAH